MTIMQLSSEVFKICLSLSLILSVILSKGQDTFESVSIISGDVDDGDVVSSSFSDQVYLDLTGTLRQTMVYHTALLDTRLSAICSPISALLPLGKLALGSSSRQYSELKRAIGYRRSKVAGRFKSVLSHLNSISGRVQLSIASRLYVSGKHSLADKFDKRVRTVFHSSCERVAFDDAQGTASNINRWVSSQSKGLIKNLIKPAEIAKDTSLIIINVVYFLGRWKNKFEFVAKNTFYAPSRQKTVSMMTKSGYLKYTNSNTLRAKIVQIPYSGKDVSFILVLPHERGGLPFLVQTLINSPRQLNIALGQMRNTHVSLSMPKFKIMTNLDLGSLYFKLGLKEIFKRNNKVLTKILKRAPVHLSKAVHAAVIEVNEYGTEAAAASAGHVVPISGVVHEKILANHPFLFYVIANGEQLFGGIYTGD